MKTPEELAEEIATENKTIEFMSKAELAPIDRYTFVVQRIAEERRKWEEENKERNYFYIMSDFTERVSNQAMNIAKEKKIFNQESIAREIVNLVGKEKDIAMASRNAEIEKAIKRAKAKVPKGKTITMAILRTLEYELGLEK